MFPGPLLCYVRFIEKWKYVMLVDTHCHLNIRQLESNFDVIMEGARQAGVSKMIVVGFDLDSSRKAVEQARKYPNLFAAVGLHPHHASQWSTDIMDQFEKWSKEEKVCAIGEIGLDYYRDLSPRDVQSDVFKAQIGLAKRCKLPIIIHCREAYEDTLRILNEESDGELGGVMHCWAGEVADAHRTINTGFHLGFGGTITYNGAVAIQEAARTIPLESILLETDAPYLSPIPFRGKTNLPEYVKIVATHMAELRGMSLEDICAASWINAHRCFPKLNCAGQI